MPTVYFRAMLGYMSLRFLVTSASEGTDFASRTAFYGAVAQKHSDLEQ